MTATPHKYLDPTFSKYDMRDQDVDKSDDLKDVKMEMLPIYADSTIFKESVEELCSRHGFSFAAPQTELVCDTSGLSGLLFISTHMTASIKTSSIPGSYPHLKKDKMEQADEFYEINFYGIVFDTILPHGVIAGPIKIAPFDDRYDFGVWDLPVNDTWNWYCFVIGFIVLSRVHDWVRHHYRNWKGYMSNKKGKSEIRYVTDLEETALLHNFIGIDGIPLLLKCGDHIKLEEARLTQYARKLFFQGKVEVKIPKIYCAIRLGKCKYILMEKVKGKTLEQMWAQLDKDKQHKVVEKLRSAVACLREKSDDSQKGVHGLQGCSLFHVALPKARGSSVESCFGPYPGVKEFNEYLYTEHYPDPTFIEMSAKGNQFVTDFLTESWYKDESTVFSHGDLSPHNIMVDDQGQVSIIDWETAGLWPRYMEYYFASRYRDEIWDPMGIALED